MQNKIINNVIISSCFIKLVHRQYDDDNAVSEIRLTILQVVTVCERTMCV